MLSLLELSVTKGAEREGAAKPKTPHILYALIRQLLCYLRLPFCNDALLLVVVRLLLKQKDTKTDICSVVCVVIVVEDGL